MHLRAVVGAPSAISQQTTPQPKKLAWLPSIASAAGQPVKSRAHSAWLAVPPEGRAGYRVHPALGDASVHLAAVPPAGQSIATLRYSLCRPGCTIRKAVMTRPCIIGTGVQCGRNR